MNPLAVLGGTPVRSEPYPPWPCFDARDEAALMRCLHSGRWGGHPYPGPETRAFVDEFLAWQGGAHAVTCANGTVSIELGLRAAQIGWSDEVIVPAYTFQATAVAVLSVGAIPVLVDVDPATYCIAPAAVEKAITRRTRAVIPVHSGHQMADMDAILDVAERHHLLVIEDAAHAHGHEWRGRGAGTLGHFGSFSLQSNKLLTSGEGGVLICRTAELARRAASIADNGRPYLGGGRTQGGAPFAFGTNWRMTELQAALARAGLERLPAQTAQRAAAAEELDGLLATLPFVRVLQRDSRHTRRAVYAYVFAIDAGAFEFDHRTVCHLLNAEGIPCWSGYHPLHRDPLFRPERSALPVPRAFPERASYEGLSLPNAEAAGETDAIWLREQVFRSGSSGVHSVVQALEKIYAERAAIVPRRFEFAVEWRGPEQHATAAGEEDGR
jgi:dTDP-4-amino-4,6-dideoxygalactose transaminase